MKSLDCHVPAVLTTALLFVSFLISILFSTLTTVLSIHLKEKHSLCPTEHFGQISRMTALSNPNDLPTYAKVDGEQGNYGS